MVSQKPTLYSGKSQSWNHLVFSPSCLANWIDHLRMLSGGKVENTQILLMSNGYEQHQPFCFSWWRGSQENGMIRVAGKQPCQCRGLENIHAASFKGLGCFAQVLGTGNKVMQTTEGVLEPVGIYHNGQPYWPSLLFQYANEARASCMTAQPTSFRLCRISRSKKRDRHPASRIDQSLKAVSNAVRTPKKGMFKIYKFEISRGKHTEYNELFQGSCGIKNS
ncbi:hypothetical protein BJV82DRAFT_579123 [Fennellomyces sp. T-0311]|nr:hypothetical protein BJV82DRAFT_579123 [Fennellomyces sp. T-0311]